MSLPRPLLLALFLVACGAPADPPPDEPTPTEEVDVIVEASYAGWAWVDDSDPTAFSITTQAELDGFLERIPERVPSKRQPAPVNQDALRDAPAPDFSSHMLVIATRDSMYVGPEILELRRGADLEVEVCHPPLGDTVHAAAVLDLGRYHAVLVPRVEGSVTGRLVPGD